MSSVIDRYDNPSQHGGLLQGFEQGRGLRCRQTGLRGLCRELLDQSGGIQPERTGGVARQRQRLLRVAEAAEQQNAPDQQIGIAVGMADAVDLGLLAQQLGVRVGGAHLKAAGHGKADQRPEEQIAALSLPDGRTGCHAICGVRRVGEVVVVARLGDQCNGQCAHGQCRRAGQRQRHWGGFAAAEPVHPACKKSKHPEEIEIPQGIFDQAVQAQKRHAHPGGEGDGRGVVRCGAALLHPAPCRAPQPGQGDDHNRQGAYQPGFRQQLQNEIMGVVDIVQRQWVQGMMNGRVLQPPAQLPPARAEPGQMLEHLPRVAPDQRAGIDGLVELARHGIEKADPAEVIGFAQRQPPQRIQHRHRHQRRPAWVAPGSAHRDHHQNGGDDRLHHARARAADHQRPAHADDGGPDHAHAQSRRPPGQPGQAERDGGGVMIWLPQIAEHPPGRGVADEVGVQRCMRRQPGGQRRHLPEGELHQSEHHLNHPLQQQSGRGHVEPGVWVHTRARAAGAPHGGVAQPGDQRRAQQHRQGDGALAGVGELPAERLQADHGSGHAKAERRQAEARPQAAPGCGEKHGGPERGGNQRGAHLGHHTRIERPDQRQRHGQPQQAKGKRLR